jgi:hypothetical protein
MSYIWNQIRKVNMADALLMAMFAAWVIGVFL